MKPGHVKKALKGSNQKTSSVTLCYFRSVFSKLGGWSYLKKKKKASLQINQSKCITAICLSEMPGWFK